MATIIRTVQNISPQTFALSHTNIVLPTGAPVDLYEVATCVELLQVQSELLDLVTRGYITVIATEDQKELLAKGIESISGTFSVNGTIIGYKDNLASLRVKGPQHASEGGADVQSYSGVYYNDSYDTNGLLKTRFITGGNEDMDLEIQSSNALLISAVGENVAGFAKIAARTNVIFNVRDEADQDSPKQLIIDRVDTGTVGAANTSDVNIKSTGSIHINNGITTGALVVPILTGAEITALTPVAGAVVFNSTTSKHQGYNGSSWNDLY